MKRGKFKKKDVCILRGGSWYFYGADIFRAHYRNWLVPDHWYYCRGFRCVSLESSGTSERFVRIMEAPNGPKSNCS